MPGKYFDQIRKVSGKVRNICLIQLETDFGIVTKTENLLLRNLDRTAQRPLHGHGYWTVPYHRKYFWPYCCLIQFAYPEFHFPVSHYPQCTIDKVQDAPAEEYSQNPHYYAASHWKALPL